MIEKFNTTAGGTAQTAIVFVHGFTGDRKGTWGNIPAFLMADPRLQGWDLYGFGYESRRRFDILGLWSADADLERISIMLNSEPALANYKRLAMVAHSMGGLVVQRALVKYAELRARTSHVFFFGTPSGGLQKAAALSFLKPQIQNMSASSDFIHQLRQDWESLKLSSGTPFKLIATAGEIDQFVPPKSSLDPFPESLRRVIPGNHITMLGGDATHSICGQIILEGLTAGAASGGPRNAAAVAVEEGHFQKVIDQLGKNPETLDDTGAVQLALALDSTGRREEAIRVLQQHRPEGTDVLGVLAGRLKRRWLVERRRDDAKNAMDLYQRGYDLATAKTPPDHDQAYYHGINLAYLELAYGADYSTAQTMAAQVPEHCKRAIRPNEKVWQLATEGDALLILGRTEEALAKHSEASRQNIGPWQALSFEEQSLRVADLCGLSQQQIQKLAALYEQPEAASTGA